MINQNPKKTEGTLILDVVETEMVCVSMDKTGELIAIMNDNGIESGVALKNAEFLCRAWNSHDNNLEILKEMAPLVEELILRLPTGRTRNDVTGFNIKLLNAIANAEVKPKDFQIA